MGNRISLFASRSSAELKVKVYTVNALFAFRFFPTNSVVSVSLFSLIILMLFSTENSFIYLCALGEQIRRKAAADGCVLLWLSRCEIHLVWLRLSRNGPSFDIEIYVNLRMGNRNSREFSGCNIFGWSEFHRTSKSVLLPDEISSKHTHSRKLSLSHTNTQVGVCILCVIFAQTSMQTLLL